MPKQITGTTDALLSYDLLLKMAKESADVILQEKGGVTKAHKTKT